jgi:hypothetical protein
MHAIFAAPKEEVEAKIKSDREVLQNSKIEKNQPRK